MIPKAATVAALVVLLLAALALIAVLAFNPPGDRKAKAKTPRAACYDGTSSLISTHVGSVPSFLPKQWAAIHNKIQPFAIYFPQFHEIRENSTLFYPGMTDVVSLQSYLAENVQSNLDTPSLGALKLPALTHYDGSNPALVRRQVELASSWGFRGFAVYFYWFSVNTITHRRQIMEACIDNFFHEPLENGFKVFFDWANEDWTKNPAFGAAGESSSVSIQNVYTRKNFEQLTDLLLTYFQHPNYLKLDDKPVLFLHHPWFMTDAEFELFAVTLKVGCLAAGFSGLHLCANRFSEDDSGPASASTGFNFRPDYKSGKFLDYESVIQDAIVHPDAANIKTMFFTFDNSARMHRPEKPHRLHIIASTSEQQKRLLHECIAAYQDPAKTKTDLEKIFLVNSWNEWGENMAIEPGSLNGFRYLQMLCDAYYALL